MKRLFNSLWILLLAAIGFTLALCFAYLFLFSEELHTNEKSIEDELVADESWIKHVLSTGDHINNQVMYSQKYGQYLYLDKHCNKTITDSKPKFTKLVLIIIDALRVDFVPSIMEPDYSTPRLPYLEQLLKTHGMGFQSIASIPTVTLARVKAILSGCLPSFMDYIMNLNAYSFKKDNIVEQLWLKNKSIVFYGDDTWGKLFHKGIFARSNFTSSLFATDYTEVDSNVTYNVNQELKNLTEWDVMMLHYLGVDHIGHLQGFNSDLFPVKLHEMDDVFRSIFDSVTFSKQTQNESYLFLITGDHGMTKSGNHGGSTRDETHTALIFVSNSKNHNFPSGYSRVLPLSERTFLQIDIAPTIAALFHFPTPAKSQGRIISPALERFDTPPGEHLCYLFQNAFQIQHIVKRQKMDDADLKLHLLDALSHHYNFANMQEAREKGQREADFGNARDAYHRFIVTLQQQHVESATNRSFLSMLTLPVLICYGIVFALVRIECVHNSGSIFFRRPFFLERLLEVRAWLPTLPHGDTIDYTNCAAYFSHLQFFASSHARALMLLLLSLNLFFMGSTNFMEYEHNFWHYLATFLLAFHLILVFRGYNAFKESKWKSIKVMDTHYWTSRLLLLFAIVLFKVMTSWRIPVITDSDLQQWDIYTWITLKKSKHALSAIFIVSLVIIAFSTSTKSTFGRPPPSFIASITFIYLYRCSTGSIRSFKMPHLIKMPPVIYAQLVYGVVILIFFYCLMLKVKSSITRDNRIIDLFYSLLDGLMLADRTDLEKSRTQHSSLLHSLLVNWMIMSTLLLEPSYVPLLVLNILLEKLVYFTFSTTSELPQLDMNYLYGQMFYRLGTYLIFASSAFYQIGNTNSLSTVNVNPCFIGVNSYIPVCCTIFMLVSVYSTYIYWIIMFFVRMQQDLMPVGNGNGSSEAADSEGQATEELDSTAVDETQQFINNLIARKNPIVLNYCTFYSIINCIMIIRLLVMTVNMTVTFLLRDHLFIWSVICPKLLYEIIISAMSLLVVIVMSIVFTHDNYFRLH